MTTEREPVAGEVVIPGLLDRHDVDGAPGVDPLEPFDCLLGDRAAALVVVREGIADHDRALHALSPGDARSGHGNSSTK